MQCLTEFLSPSHINRLQFSCVNTIDPGANPELPVDSLDKMSVDVFNHHGLGVDMTSPHAATAALQMYAKKALNDPLCYLISSFHEMYRYAKKGIVDDCSIGRCFTLAHFGSIAGSDVKDESCGSSTSISAGFSCRMVHEYDTLALSSKATRLSRLSVVVKYILSPYVYSLLRSLVEDADENIQSFLRKLGAFGALFEPFALERLNETPMKLNDRMITYQLKLNLPTTLPNEKLHSMLDATARLQPNTVLECLKGQPYLDAVLLAEGEITFTNTQLTTASTTDTASRPDTTSSTGTLPASGTCKKVLFLFKITTASSYIIQRPDVYRELVKGLMEANAVDTVVAVLVVPHGITPSPATFSSYVPLATMLTHPHPTGGSSDMVPVPVPHQQDFPSVLMLQLITPGDVYQCVSLAYESPPPPTPGSEPVAAETPPPTSASALRSPPEPASSSHTPHPHPALPSPPLPQP
jgi:hypothetical protein